MKRILKISLAQQYGTHLTHRDYATFIFDAVKRDPADVEIDFNNIEFVSRTFADQFIKEKRNIESQFKIKISFKNINEQIIRLFQSVNKTLESTRKEKRSEITYLTFSEQKHITDYLLSI